MSENSTVFALLVFGLSLLLPLSVAAQQTGIPERPLVEIDQVSVETGLPRVNLGYPTQHVIDPEVGRVVRLAQGFDYEPDFTYSFTHPLAQYANPLAYQGPFGTFNSPFVPANESPPRLKLLAPRTATSAERETPKHLSTQITYLPAPWLLAAQNATYHQKQVSMLII